MDKVGARYLAQCIACAPAVTALPRGAVGRLNWTDILARSGVPEPAWPEPGLPGSPIPPAPDH